MIKGVNKNAVILTNLKNDTVEEVIFILKPSAKKPSRASVMREVKKIISEKSDVRLFDKKPKKMKKN